MPQIIWGEKFSSFKLNKETEFLLYKEKDWEKYTLDLSIEKVIEQ